MAKLNSINLIIALGAFNAFFAVATGSLAAHALKDSLSIEYIEIFKTAADYQLIHGLGLILIGVLNKTDTCRYNITVAIIMFMGIILFSGSLYLYTLTGIKWLAMITPLGGVFFLVSWLMMTLNYLSMNEQ